MLACTTMRTIKHQSPITRKAFLTKGCEAQHIHPRLKRRRDSLGAHRKHSIFGDGLPFPFSFGQLKHQGGMGAVVLEAQDLRVRPVRVAILPLVQGQYLSAFRPLKKKKAPKHNLYLLRPRRRAWLELVLVVLLYELGVLANRRPSCSEAILHPKPRHRC